MSNDEPIQNCHLHELVSSSTSNSATKDAESGLEYANVIPVETAIHNNNASLVDLCETVLCHTQDASGLPPNESLQSSNNSMERQVETLKTLLQSALGREENAKVTVQSLQSELERLTDLLDRNVILIARKDNEAEQLLHDLVDWKSQATSANERMTAKDIECQKLQSQKEQLQVSYSEIMENSVLQKEHLAEKNDEVKRENERRLRLEMELESVQTKLQAKTQECIDKQYAAATCQSKVASLEKNLLEAKKATSLKVQELNEEIAKSENLVKVKAEQKKALTEQLEKNAQFQIEQKKLLVEHNQLILEKAELERNLEAEHKSFLRLQQLADDSKVSLRKSDDDVQLLNKEVEKLRRRENEFNREILILKREHSVQLGRIQSSEDIVKKSYSEIEDKEKKITSLEIELAEAKNLSAKQDHLSCRLEGECDGLRHQLKETQVHCQRVIDENKMLENQSKVLNKMIEDLQNQIEIQTRSTEKIKEECNNVLTDLKDSQKAILVLQQEKKDDHHLLDTLRSELSNKESDLIKETYACSREKAQKDIYADEISRLKKSVAQNEDEIRIHQSDARRLGTAIRKLEDSVTVRTREYDHVLLERDILGSSLIRRNDELALMYEKIKILQSTQRRGELQYNARLDDIRILKIKARDLQRQLAIAQGGQAGYEELSRKLTASQKELIRERLKVKALSDELENPINVHRWHKLEGSDPKSFDMIQKIQILQKRLLQKSEEVVKKNGIIRDHEKRQLDMEKDLARQPGPEMAEQLLFYQNDVSTKIKQMKAMASELNMHQTQINEYKREIENLETEVLNYKKKYFEQKKRETLRELAANTKNIKTPPSFAVDVKRAKEEYNTSTAKISTMGGIFGTK
ncbi:hypothetical protein ACHAXA_009183 [Cyclostephanos tholiformis]|uniref:Cilia- and flagella-associated protein 58 central coiled coil domain-containing protein n=1 Tax=Cyclostephanos tholiformis TaxID=382380 RepID=A0ABD3RRE5_9STRA